MVNIFNWFRNAKNEAELLRPNLPKSKQQEMLNKLNLYEDTELYWIFISYIVPEDFMRELFYKFGPPKSKGGIENIDDWVFWQDVSEEFVREFIDYISSDTLGAKHKLLNLNYMREYKDVMEWRNATDKFQWTKKTLKEFKNYIDLRMLKSKDMTQKDKEVYEEIFG